MGVENLQDIVTIKELADFLKVSEITIRRAIDSGDLKALKIGKSWRIEKEAVIEWLKEE
jgi:excisionase family DNA binding protein